MINASIKIKQDILLGRNRIKIRYTKKEKDTENKMTKSDVACGDCGCKEGEMHKPNCDMERCPFCYGQLLSCDCRYIKLGYNIDNSKIYCGLPKDIYKHGLTNEQHKKWTQILEKKGRIPFVLYPLICARCGELWPKFFMVPDEEWKKYIQPDKRDAILCAECYNDIKQLINRRMITEIRK